MYVFYQTRGLIILIIGYSLVHIIGIPLIAYRFLIEPFLIVIFIGLIFSYATELLKKYQPHTGKREKMSFKYAGVYDSIMSAMIFCDLRRKHKNWKGRFVNIDIIIIYAAVLLLLSAMMIPFAHKPEPAKHTYFALLKSKEVLNYRQLREMQWNNLGDIKPETHIAVQGVVRYTHQGFKYVEDDYYAKKDSKFTAARLFVRYGDKNNPLGSGDVRLNLKNSSNVKDGDVIKVIGTAKTGPFKEIIIDSSLF